MWMGKFMEHVSALNLRTQHDASSSDDRAGTPETLFVINLCASMAPLPASDLRIAGLEQFKIFQIARVEDGRTRHRVRVGFFAQESDAESVVAGLRERFPTAFITTAISEDRRHMRSANVRPASAKPATRATDAVKSAPAAATITASAPAVQRRPDRVEPAVAKTSAPTPAPKVAPPAAKVPPAQAKTVASEPVRETPAAKAAAAVLELSYDDAPLNAGKSSDALVDGPRHAPPPVLARIKDPSAIVINFSVETEARKAPPAASKPAANAKPFHVGANAEIPFLDLALEADPLNSGKSEKASPATGRQAADKHVVEKQPNERQGAAAAAAMQKLSSDDIWRMEDLDSTQTIRTLSKAELSDANQPKWYVVQLALSNQAVNMDAMPQLDIFTAYRLYSVAVMEEGKILHALRLGFFKEEVSAEAVRGYVRTFFASPDIIRVSTAEQARFAEAPTPTVKPASKVVEINIARERAAIKDAVDAAPAKSASTEPSNAPRAAAKSAVPAARSAPRTPANRAAGTVRQNTSALDAKLRQAAKEIALTQSGMHKMKGNSSLFSRLVGKLKS
jgi:hypothetical protein